jgi:hypothetical protein
MGMQDHHHSDSGSCNRKLKSVTCTAAPWHQGVPINKILSELYTLSHTTPGLEVCMSRLSVLMLMTTRRALLCNLGLKLDHIYPSTRMSPAHRLLLLLWPDIQQVMYPLVAGDRGARVVTIMLAVLCPA